MAVTGINRTLNAMDQRDFRSVPAGTDVADVLTVYAAALRALPPSCGPVRLVAVDGFAGSGKSTFAGRLAPALGGAPVVHLDDLATHDELFEWTDRFRSEVLEPLRDGRTARHRVYDWTRRRFDGVREIPPAPVVVVEGVGAGRRALRPGLAQVLWLDVPRDTARALGERRDGPELADFWTGWMAAQDRHFAQDPTRPYADRLVTRGRQGYAMRPGPAGGRPGEHPRERPG
jgi:uridine kinase